MRNLCGRVSAWRLQFFWFTPNMFSSLSSSFNSFGVVNGTLYLVGRVLQALSCGRARLIRYYIVAQPVPNPFVPMCKLSETERVHEAGLESPLVGFFPRPQEVVRSRFQRGHVCLVATSKDRFSGFLWFARELYDEDEVHWRNRDLAFGTMTCMSNRISGWAEPSLGFGMPPTNVSRLLASNGPFPEFRHSIDNPSSLTSALELAKCTLSRLFAWALSS